KAYSGRGQCFARLKDYEPALRDFAQALKLDQQFVEAYAGRGALYRERLEQLHRLGLCAAVLAPYPAEAASFLFVTSGIVAQGGKIHDRAFADLTRVIELDGKNASAFAERRQLYVLDAQARGVPPDAVVPFLAGGDNALVAGKYDVAVTEYTKAVVLDAR